eukprot:scaffold544_cov117-Isochrysis_galbana.AAC.7
MQSGTASKSRACMRRAGGCVARAEEGIAEWRGGRRSGGGWCGRPVLGSGGGGGIYAGAVRRSVARWQVATRLCSRRPAGVT